MFMKRFVNSIFPRSLLVNIYGMQAIAILILLFVFGCGNESINESLDGRDDSARVAEDFVPVFTSYYPMTVGNRWVYRDPDGSEWTREVTETKKSGANDYHFFSSDPPLQDTQIESLRSTVYAAYLDRLDRRIGLNDINAAIRETIVESGGETQDWGLGMSCNNRAGGKPVCVSRKDKSTPGILTYLYRSNTRIDEHRKLTLLRFPIVPGETYKALNLSLKGRAEGPFYIHVYGAEGVIAGEIMDVSELVETSAGAFEDCLKIQYEPKLTSYRTVKFREFTANPMTGAYLKAVESDIREELTDLLTRLMPKLGLHTMWLAPGVGPVKIETPNGIAELIDYEIKGNSGE